MRIDPARVISGISVLLCLLAVVYLFLRAGDDRLYGCYGWGDQVITIQSDKVILSSIVDQGTSQVHKVRNIDARTARGYLVTIDNHVSYDSHSKRIRFRPSRNETESTFFVNDDLDLVVREDQGDRFIKLPNMPCDQSGRID